MIIDNIITVSSTPRSRLLADVLLKIGLVERSGQGVDKIFAISLSEGKHEPDYSATDFYQVSLKLNCEVTDLAFFQFLRETQERQPVDEKLGVHDIIALSKVRNGYSLGLDAKSTKKLESLSLIDRVGSGSSRRYVLGAGYREFSGRENRVGNYVMLDVATVVSVLENEPDSRMGDFLRAFDGRLNRSQVKYLIEKLLEDGIIKKKGTGSGTRYFLNESFASSASTFDAVESFLISIYVSH